MGGTHVQANARHLKKKQDQSQRNRSSHPWRRAGGHGRGTWTLRECPQRIAGDGRDRVGGKEPQDLHLAGPTERGHMLATRTPSPRDWPRGRKTARPRDPGGAWSRDATPGCREKQRTRDGGWAVSIEGAAQVMETHKRSSQPPGERRALRHSWRLSAEREAGAGRATGAHRGAGGEGGRAAAPAQAPLLSD